MKHLDVAETLINQTISVIASDGLEHATTRAIVKGTTLQEVYIYRNFTDKEHLIAAAFESVEKELFEVALQTADILTDSKVDLETRCYTFFSAVWDFLLSHQDMCLTYVRYYFSPYFSRFSAEAHTERCTALASRCSGVFRADVSEIIIIKNMLNMMCCFAHDVLSNMYPKGKKTKRFAFLQVYSFLLPYFNESAACSA